MEYLSDKNLGLCGKEIVLDFFKFVLNLGPESWGRKWKKNGMCFYFFFSWTLFHKMWGYAFI